jgi:hypothetical protein
MGSRPGIAPPGQRVVVHGHLPTVRVLCACMSPQGALRAQFGALISASFAVFALEWWGSAWFDSHPLPPLQEAEPNTKDERGSTQVEKLPPNLPTRAVPRS